MVKQEINTNELGETIRNYMNAHSSDYSNLEREFILNNYTWGKRSNYTGDILEQVYDITGVNDPQDNIYKGFIDLLYSEYDIKDSDDIIEVGGGKLPRLSYHIAEKQINGTVKVYDPNLILQTETRKNMVLVDDRFTEKSYLGNPRIIVGLMPCDATEVLMETACRNGIDFMVALCEGNCTQDDCFDDFSFGNSWHDDMIYKAKNEIEKAGRGKLLIKDLQKYGDPNPVLLYKR